MKSTPKHDLSTSYPLGLKPQLATLPGYILFDLWCESDYKESIALSDHTIPDNHHLEASGSKTKYWAGSIKTLV